MKTMKAMMMKDIGVLEYEDVPTPSIEERRIRSVPAVGRRSGGVGPRQRAEVTAATATSVAKNTWPRTP